MQANTLPKQRRTRVPRDKGLKSAWPPLKFRWTSVFMFAAKTPSLLWPSNACSPKATLIGILPLGFQIN